VWSPVYGWAKRGGTCVDVIPSSLKKADGTFTSTLAETGGRLLEVLVPRDDASNESLEQKSLRRATGIIGVFSVKDLF